MRIEPLRSSTLCHAELILATLGRSSVPTSSLNSERRPAAYTISPGMGTLAFDKVSSSNIGRGVMVICEDRSIFTSTLWVRYFTQFVKAALSVYDAPVLVVSVGHDALATDVMQSQYVGHILDYMKPQRVILLGRPALIATLGVTKAPGSIGYNGYGYTSYGAPVPFFPMPNLEAGYTPQYTANCMIDALTRDYLKPPEKPEMHVIETVDDAEYACAQFVAAGGLTFDTETSGTPMGDYFELYCLSATPYGVGDRVYVWDRPAVANRELTQPFRKVMMNGRVAKCGHNLKYDMLAVGDYLKLVNPENGELMVYGDLDDTMLWCHQLDTEASAGLAYSDNIVAMGGHKAENEVELDKAKKLIRYCRRKGIPHDKENLRPLVEAVHNYPDSEPDKFAYALVPQPVLTKYCALDTLACELLRQRVPTLALDHDAFALVARQLVTPLTRAAAQIETWGMHVDVDHLSDMDLMLREALAAKNKELHELGCSINLNSPAQLASYIFGSTEQGGLGLDSKKSTATGAPSTDAEVLESLRNAHPVIPVILEYRTLSKVHSTYVTGLNSHITKSGRVRTNIDTAGTRSGRLSSKEPNLQNIITGGGWGKKIKKLFAAPKGRLIVQLDYSQLEVRIAAALSSEPVLAEAYKSGLDVHRNTAAMAFGVPVSDVTTEQRRAAKTVVFGLMYGKSAFSLARDLGVTKERGKEIYDSVLGGLDSLRAWMDDQREFVAGNGYSRTYIIDSTGEKLPARMRNLMYIGSNLSSYQSKANNAAVNSPIQGTASDYMVRSLDKIIAGIFDNELDAKVVNTVHDSVILEVADKDAVKVISLAKRIMESWPCAGVPLVADVELGPTWGSLVSFTDLVTAKCGVEDGMTHEDIAKLSGYTEPVALASGTTLSAIGLGIEQLVGRVFGAFRPSDDAAAPKTSPVWA